MSENDPHIIKWPDGCICVIVDTPWPEPRQGGRAMTALLMISAIWLLVAYYRRARAMVRYQEACELIDWLERWEDNMERRW